MTISTPHVAFANLTFDTIPRCVKNKIGYTTLLFITIAMIKLKHDGISFATVHARMIAQVAENRLCISFAPFGAARVVAASVLLVAFPILLVPVQLVARSTP